jgi:hypothetical protein
MSLTDPERLELDALCSALIDGTASKAQHTRLEQMLASSEEARAYYVRALALSASLFEYAGEMQMEAPESFRTPTESEMPARALWWTLGSLAAAAVVVLAWWLGGGTGIRNGADVIVAAQDGDEFVARISGLKDARWDGGTFAVGDELRRDQKMRLASGFAEIAFDCGAVITLEGPAALDLTSEWDAVLRHGTLNASVPREAVGFRVSNPAVEVVDLGTEFSMVADADGATEVFVVKGAVEARASGSGNGAVVLRESQARRFAGAASSEVRDREQKLGKLARKIAMGRIARPVGYGHWSFDEAAGAAQVETVGLAQRELFAPLQGGVDLRTDGRWQRALQLDGQHYGTADLGALAPGGPRTAAFWVRLPADSQISEAAAMLSWTGGKRGNPTVEIGWNRNPRHGPVGALRTEVGRAFIVGTTQLRDGNWHHIALVFRPAPGRQKKLQVRQYIDGRLESVSARRGGAGRDRQKATGPPSLWVGCGAEGSGDRFRGALDELFIADQPLTPQEIKSLIQFNRMPVSNTVAAQ